MVCNQRRKLGFTENNFIGFYHVNVAMRCCEKPLDNNYALNLLKWKLKKGFSMPYMEPPRIPHNSHSLRHCLPSGYSKKCESIAGYSCKCICDYCYYHYYIEYYTGTLKPFPSQTRRLCPGFNGN